MDITGEMWFEVMAELLPTSLLVEAFITLLAFLYRICFVKKNRNIWYNIVEEGLKEPVNLSHT